MRIGTWNLDGAWSAEHASVLLELNCEVLLLTECPVDVSLPKYAMHATALLMSGDRKHWAAVLSTRPIQRVPDPHPASAAAIIGELFVCASVLPWPLAHSSWPWGPQDHAGRMRETVVDLVGAMAGRPVLWGGDWNQPLEGGLAGFSRAAQESISAATEALDLQVPTASLPSRAYGQCSIDHVAVPNRWTVNGSGCFTVEQQLSDHDAYWIEALP